MKNSPKTIMPDFLRAGRCLLALIVCVICTAQSAAQADPAQTGQVRLARTRGGEANGRNAETAPEEADFKTPQVKFPRKWNEDRATLRLTVENPEATELKIQGVQTSPGLYVVNFPQTIKAGASGEIDVHYAARAGATGDTDVVRLLTNQGEKEIQVVQEREAAITLDSQTMTWKVGDEGTPKTITLSLEQPGLRAVGLRVFGGKPTQAQLRQISPGRYEIQIAPESTSAPAQFSVMVNLTPEVPGNIPVIQCSVIKAD
jgi:hypothetical protein